MYSTGDFPFQNGQIDFPGVIPSNAGMGMKAKRLVEQYAKSAIKEYEEALVAQGIKMTLFNQISTQRNCTCCSNVLNSSNRQLQQTEQEELLNNLYSTQNNTLVSTKMIDDDDTIISPLEKHSASSRHDIPTDFLPDKQKQLRKTNKTSYQRSLELGEEEDIDFNNLEDNIYQRQQKSTNYEDVRDHPGINSSKNTINDIFQLQNFGTLRTGENDINTKSCPICLGTYKTDTYQPYNGKRYILCGDGFYETSYQNSQLNRSTFPYEFNLDAFGSVTFKINLPSYFEVLKIQKYYGRNINNNIKLLFSSSTGSTGEEENADYIELTKENLTARVNKNNEDMYIKVKNTTNIIQSFTHIEIVLSYSRRDVPLFVVAMGKVDFPGESAFADIYGSASAQLSPRLENWLTRGSILAEEKYGFCWEVESISKNYTTNKTLFQLDTSLRLVQEAELYNLLNVYDTKLSRKGRFIS